MSKFLQFLRYMFRIEDIDGKDSWDAMIEEDDQNVSYLLKDRY